MKKIILIIVVLFFSQYSFSQINRMNDSERYINRKPKEKKKSDILDASLTFLKTELELDSFQEAVFKNLLKENDEKASQIINAETLEIKEKEELIEKVTEEFKMEAFKILSNEQKKKYEAIFDKKENKKKKK